MIIIAIATNGGHVARAMDFYGSAGKYFIVGGTKPWTHMEEGQIVTDDSTPPSPSQSDFKLTDVVALKKVDNVYLVVPDSEGTIKYREQSWRIVSPSTQETLVTQSVTKGDYNIKVDNVAGLNVRSRVRVGNTYEGTITSISGSTLTLDTAAPSNIEVNAPVINSPAVEGAKYVYVECYLNYDRFPIVPSYRQIGLCTGVTPDTADVLKAAAYTGEGVDEYTSLGVLEILDNRAPIARNINQRELLSLIIEF